MAILEVEIIGSPVLRKKAKAVRKADKSLSRLLGDMLETMDSAPGVGLAAPQVGRSVRAIVARVEEEEHRLVNPRVVKRQGQVEGMEGCLSLPGLQGLVVRPERVVVKALTERMRPIEVEAEGFLARVLCHEIDHLDGILFTDRADPDSLYWLVPDEESEDGFRREPTTLEEALAEFEQMRRQPQRA
ncbi:MAG: peptide deformylase [Armatimonadota bacterium]